MTTKQTDADADALHQACASAGLRSNDAAPLHKHATSVWLLRDLGIVARLSPAPEDRARIARAITITRWLEQQDFPAVQPIDIDQPVEVGQISVTFWRYYPQDTRGTPHAAHLGRLLKQLHRLPHPPIALHPYRPLTHLGKSLQADALLSADDHAWLTQRRAELLNQYAGIESQLGIGFIHGDAYPGNTLWDGDAVRLGDWDEIATGPRELDLINTHQGARVGRPKAERDAFTEAYGWDVTTWPGFPTLRDMRDLHSLAAFIDLAASGNTAATEELHHRIATIRSGGTTTRWHIR